MSPFSIRSSWLLFAAILVGLALRIPGWFTGDEKKRFALFEPDEFQYVDMAIYQVQCLDSTLLTDWEVKKNIFNVRGYGNLLGLWGYVAHTLTGVELTPSFFIHSGRVCSTLFWLLGLLVLYQLLLWWQPESQAASWGIAFFAVLDLSVTYSHYALPEVPYATWGIVFVYGLCRWWEGDRAKYALIMALGAAGTLAYKFDFLPILMLGMTVLIKFYQKPRRTSGQLVVIVFGLLLSFALLTAFNYSWADIQYSFSEIRRQNQDVVAGDRHWLHNPLIYLLAVLATVGLPLAITAGMGILNVLGSRRTLSYLILGWLALEFGARWAVDAPFTRRLEVFMPWLAFFAALGVVQWRTRYGWLVGLYALGITLVGQSNHWFDSRYAAREWLLVNTEGRTIKYSPYAFAAGMPPGVGLKEEGQLFVMHESYYSRYGYSFTTPFKLPQCCEEVYHCQGEELCGFYQQLIQNSHPDYQEIAVFQTREFFPERWLFHYWFGSFDTFVGDTRVFGRQEK